MSLFSWFNSAGQVDTALLYVAVIGAIIEAGVAVAAVINVHKELEESRKAKLEKYIEVFACVAAFFFLAEAILGCRSSVLLGIELENLKTQNLVLEAKLQPRIITMEQITNFIFLTEKVTKAVPIIVMVGPDNEDNTTYAFQFRALLDLAGFHHDQSVNDFGITIDQTAYELTMIGATNKKDPDDLDFVAYNINGDYRYNVKSFEIAPNGIVRPVVTETNAEQVYDALLYSLGQCKIKCGVIHTATWVKPGEFEFFVPPRMN